MAVRRLELRTHLQNNLGPLLWSGDTSSVRSLIQSVYTSCLLQDVVIVTGPVGKYQREYSAKEIRGWDQACPDANPWYSVKDTLEIRPKLSSTSVIGHVILTFDLQNSVSAIIWHVIRNVAYTLLIVMLMLGTIVALSYMLVVRPLEIIRRRMLAVQQNFENAESDSLLNNAYLQKGFREIREMGDLLEDNYRTIQRQGQWFKILFERSSIPLVVMETKQMTILDANAAAAHILGLLSRAELVGKTPLQFSPKMQYDGHSSEDVAKEKIAAVLANGQEQFLWHHLRPDGTQWDALVHLMLIESIQGPQFLFTLRDVTETRRNELERQGFLTELKAQNQELESLIYILSHDLRSPLVNIEGFSEELVTDIRENTGSVPSDVQKSIDIIRHNTNRMSKIINAVVKTLRERRQEVEFSRVDAETILASVAKDLAVRLRDSGMTLFMEPLPPCWGDAVGLEIVFCNLLDNAIKYRTSDQGGWIRIRGELQGTFVVYEIEDNGIGIPPKFRDKVFQLFTRLVSKHDYEGDGVGLASVRAIMQRMGGEVNARDPHEKEGKTCFALRLPVPPPT